jgi:hypothetical protein
VLLLIFGPYKPNDEADQPTGDHTGAQSIQARVCSNREFIELLPNSDNLTMANDYLRTFGQRFN